MSDAVRRRAFVVAAVVVAATVALLWRDGATRGAPEPVRTGPADVVAPPPPASASAPAATAERESGPVAVVSDADLAAARTATRGFLAGYLRLADGRGSVGRITHVAPELRNLLRRDPPRVTPAQQGRRTTVVGVAAEGQSPQSVRAGATLRAGDDPAYGLLLYLERRGRRWVVVRISDT